MKCLKNQKGSALVITIILIMVVTIFGTAMLFSVANEVKMNRAMEENIIADYLAQAGIDHGLYLIENEPELEYPYVDEITLGDKSRMYRMVINEDGPEITIRSTGIIEVDGVVKKQVMLEARILEDGRVEVSK